MKQDEKKAVVFELADSLLQSWWTVIAGICLGVAGALVALHLITSVYMASATILIIPQKIPEDLVPTTVTENMTQRMVAMEEAVLSEGYMRQMIAEVYGLPDSEERIQRMIRSVRSRILITPTVADRSELFAFELAFSDDEAERTARVANMLAELYVEQNTEFRSNQARDTARTLEQRAQEARTEFEAVDRELAAFNGRHSFETEAHLEANVSLREGRARDLEAARSRLRVLDQELGSLRGRLEQARTGAASSAQALARARDELAELLRRYSAAHPTVKAKQKEIDALIETGVVEPDDDRNLPASPEVVTLETQIEEARREATLLRENVTKLETEIAEYERRINAVPRVQPRLTALQNRHTLARERYEAAQKRADQARESEFLEESLRGERFELAQRAEVPRLPIFPQPPRFIALGVIAGLLLFVGPLLARRYLNPLVFSEAGLRTMTDVPVLVSLPRIQSASTQGYGARRFLKNLAFSTLSTLILVATIVVLKQYGG